MSNYNYSSGGKHDGNPQAVMAYFDKLGPKLRQVLNDARIMWGPVNLYEEGIVKRHMSDEAIAKLVAGNDARMLEKLEAERSCGQGVWSMAGFQLKKCDTRQEISPRTSRRGRGHRPSSAWLKQAMARAKIRDVPRSEVVHPSSATERR